MYMYIMWVLLYCNRRYRDIGLPLCTCILCGCYCIVIGGIGIGLPLEETLDKSQTEGLTNQLTGQINCMGRVVIAVVGRMLLGKWIPKNWRENDKK